MTRWNLDIQDDTDRLVRSYLAEQAESPRDLSAVVDEAVRRFVFWKTADHIKTRNAGVQTRDIDADIEAALAEARADRS